MEPWREVDPRIPWFESLLEGHEATDSSDGKPGWWRLDVVGLDPLRPTSSTHRSPGSRPRMKEHRSNQFPTETGFRTTTSGGGTASTNGIFDRHPIPAAIRSHPIARGGASDGRWAVPVLRLFGGWFKDPRNRRMRSDARGALDPFPWRIGKVHHVAHTEDAVPKPSRNEPCKLCGSIAFTRPILSTRIRAAVERKQLPVHTIRDHVRASPHLTSNRQPKVCSNEQAIQTPWERHASPSMDSVGSEGWPFDWDGTNPPTTSCTSTRSPSSNPRHTSPSTTVCTVSPGRTAERTDTAQVRNDHAMNHRY